MILRCMPATNFTAFPNVLLDRVMPHLNDTEFRVLAVIVRQTFGWQKEAKWLSHSLLRRSTGRESAAISRAVDQLVKRGLIVIRDADNRRLNRAAERRRSKSKLVFSIHPLLIQSAKYRMRIGFGRSDIGSSETENNKTEQEEITKHGDINA